MKKLFTLLSFLFLSLMLKSATFESIANGSWMAASTWSMTAGSDIDGVPDFSDDVIITTHTVTLANAANSCRNFTNTATGTLVGNSKKLYLKGNFTNQGKILTNIDLNFLSNSLFSSTPTYTNTGTFWLQSAITVTIASGTTINKVGPIRFQTNTAKVVNLGDVTLKNLGSTLGTLYFMKSANKWTNASGSSLCLSANISTVGATSPTLDCSANSNTMTYSMNVNQIFDTEYYNLNLSSNTSKNLSSDLHVLNNLTITGIASNRLYSNGNNIFIGGNLTNNLGLIDTETSGDTVIFNGIGNTQTVSGTKVNRFWNLKIDNPGGSVSFTTNQLVINDLIMTNGNCNSNTSKLTLVSDENATAAIAQITNTASVSFSGSMVIQKYIQDMYLADDAPGGMYYDLSVPVSNTNVMDWDNEMYISGIGDYDGIGGPAGVDGYTTDSSSTMKTYDETTNTFSPVTGTNTALAVGKGYQLLMADDAAMSFWNDKTIDSRGTPNYGDVKLTGLSYTGSAGGGWHLVGNPYASAIDFDLLTRANVNYEVYYTDQGNYSDYLANIGTIIPSYQGFYIVASSGGFGAKSITFHESSKVDDHMTAFYKNKPKYDIRLNLSSALTPYAHKNHIIFKDNMLSGYDEGIDAVYRKFPKAVAPAIYMKDAVSNKGIITNYMNSNADNQTIPLEIFTPKTGVYYVDVEVLNYQGYNQIWIENTKTGDKFDILNQVPIQGEEMKTNSDYVLRMSKSSAQNPIIKADDNVLIYTTENTLNLKSSFNDQVLKEVKIYDLSGKLVLALSNVAINNINAYCINISSLQAGIYVVNTINEQMQVKNHKIIK
ncbi:MAG: T9SS type A sorting domain-containing protein [Bacteroidia bacterium]|nr:T9SS type A sorting domain-containing protein [Bacteroidia bacterium]